MGKWQAAFKRKRLPGERYEITFSVAVNFRFIPALLSGATLPFI
jgi:hypothetical protein